MPYQRPPLYDTWKSMVRRCSEPKDASYRHYGAKGVRVCARWLDYSTFLADVSPRPSPKHTLDRIDNAGNYEPSNVRWATQAEQLRNQARSRRITLNGVTRCLADWCAFAGFSQSMVRVRLKSGWPMELALTAPKHSRLRNLVPPTV